MEKSSLIDTHCHLASDQLKDHVEAILQRAKQAGIRKIINIAYDPASVDVVLAQLSLSEILYATVGIQPHDASSFTQEAAEKIKQQAMSYPRVVGIGEIGLDAYHTLSPIPQQIECFEYFLQAALDTNLPVVVHVRETHDEVYSRIKSFSKKGLRGVIHCFTGNKQEASDFLDCGMFISLSGIATFKNAHQVHEVAKFLPDDRILIETDSPYLSPIPLRGKVNEPSHLVHTCKFIADLRQISSEQLAQLTFQNAHTLFTQLNS